MEERNDIMSLLLRGCNLARSLESNLPNMANIHPQIIAHQCVEIIEAFTMARHLLNPVHSPPLDHPYEREVAAMTISGEMTAFGYIQQGQEEEEKGKEVVGEVAEGSMKTADNSGGQEQQRNPRRSSRRDAGAEDKRTVRVPVPQTGNTEVPPEDGFTWRKYGQKEILGAKHPRSYYRCTHQKLYNCPAKKLVQRLNDDPFTYEITYRWDHICHVSSTAPSVPPPPSQAVQDIIFQHQPITTAASSLNQWLFVDFPTLSGEAANTGFDSHHHLFRVSSSGSILGNNDAPAGPSTVGSHHQGVDCLNNPIMDLADVMFNSGSSSSNSMEIIFPPSDDRKD